MDSYTKLRIIGSGSFGTVWLIRSKLNQRSYVLKEIPLSAMVQENERTFVLNEVKVLSKLRHKNIIRYKEAFFNNGLLCISMEFAHEGDLLNKIQEQAGRMFSQEQVIDWFIQLCLSLKYLHGMNILHRDIKSSNIFLAKDSVIKLGDFGIACVLQNTLDHAKTIIGTPYYLSPEICQRQPYNHKSDMWALGCVLYEMVTLKHPFQSQDFPRLVLKILHSDYEDIPEIHGPLLSDLITVLLRVVPAERPSAKQILHIPAMKTYVDKVLGRGRMQRSESVSCASNEDDVLSGEIAWRRPSEVTVQQTAIPKQDGVTWMRKDSSRENHMSEGSNYIEKRNLITPSLTKAKLENPLLENPVEKSNELKQSCETRVQRKRPSSGAFYIDNERNHFTAEGKAIELRKPLSDTYVKKTLAEDKTKGRDDHQCVPAKIRSYSTSQVRESGIRKLQMPKKPDPGILNETHDVTSDQRQLYGRTFTINSGPRSSLNKEAENETRSVGSCDVQQSVSRLSRPAQGDRNDTLDFIKVMLKTKRWPLGDVSPNDTISRYMTCLRSHLKKMLGSERFDTVYRYLAVDAQEECESGNDITENLLEALGEEDVSCIPLVMQLVQCEALIS